LLTGGLLVTSIAATMLYYYLRQCKFSRYSSAFGAIFCFLLSGPIQFIYASHGTVITWAFIFTIGAALLALRLVDCIAKGRLIAACFLAASANRVIDDLVLNLSVRK